MAQKRMFDKKVVESDKFIDLPNSSKALYFMAGMEADDKGFFQPKKLQRMCGFSDDDYKILIAKSFFITFESGVMVITDWNKNNWLDSRRITETEYIDELNMLKLINQKYEFRLENIDAKQMLSENSIEESSIEENRIEESSSSIEETIFDYYQQEIGTLTPRQYEILNNYCNCFNEEIIKIAINKTADSNVKSFNYMEAILKDWKQKGFKTIGDVNNENKSKEDDYWNE